MDFDSKFQRTIIDSLLYERRRKIDKIACMKNINIDDYSQFKKTLNSVSIDDFSLERKLEQTARNINLILNEEVKGFTSEEIKIVEQLKEKFEWNKEDFSDFKADRIRRQLRLEDTFSYSHDLGKEIIRYLDEDDDDFIRRYHKYVDFQYYIENPLAEITLRKWESQLTNPREYQEGEKFKFLVHAISTNNQTALRNAKSNFIISTSLITDEFQGTYKKSKFGFVYLPSIKNVLLMSSSDCYANALPFSSSLGESFSALTSIPLGTNCYLHYMDQFSCKTMHIEEIEKESKILQKSEENFDNHCSYNEIVLINDPYTNPIAVFLLETENIIASIANQAEELANQLNLPFLKIQKSS